MAFCAGCGGELLPEAAFCPKCGRAVQPGAAPAPALDVSAGLSQNVAALLSYAAGWVTGLIFFLIDKRPFVRFHAMQSLILFGALHVFSTLFFWGFAWYGSPRSFRGFFYWGPAFAFHSLFNLLVFVLWVVLMIKAYKGERFKLPVVGDLAEKYAA